MQKRLLEGEVTLSKAGRRNVTEPCINMGQSETQGVKVGSLGKRIRQPMVYRIQLACKTLNAASKNFPRNILERTLNPPLALSATS